MYDILIKMPAENFIKDVVSSLDRFKLKKVMSMITQNTRELQTASQNEDASHFQLVHKQLNEWKMQLSKKLGTVIVQ